MTPSSPSSSICSGYDLTPLTPADASLPEPDVVDGRFVLPWPGFTLPCASGVMKYLAKSKDESGIPPTKVLVTNQTLSFLQPYY